MSDLNDVTVERKDERVVVGGRLCICGTYIPRGRHTCPHCYMHRCNECGEIIYRTEGYQKTSYGTHIHGRCVDGPKPPEHQEPLQARVGGEAYERIVAARKGDFGEHFPGDARGAVEAVAEYMEDLAIMALADDERYTAKH